MLSQSRRDRDKLRQHLSRSRRDQNNIFRDTAVNVEKTISINLDTKCIKLVDTSAMFATMK